MQPANNILQLQLVSFKQLLLNYSIIQTTF